MADEGRVDDGMFRKVAGLGVGAVLLCAILYLFALDQVTDTTTPAMANAIDQTLSRSLDPAVKSRVTMMRDGKGVAAPRTYTARLRLSAPVAADRGASARLCERAGEIVAGYVDAVRAPITLHMIADAADGTTVAEYTVRREADPKAPFVPIPSPPETPQR